MLEAVGWRQGAHRSEKWYGFHYIGGTRSLQQALPFPNEFVSLLLKIKGQPGPFRSVALQSMWLCRPCATTRVKEWDFTKTLAYLKDPSIFSPCLAMAPMEYGDNCRNGFFINGGNIRLHRRSLVVMSRTGRDLFHIIVAWSLDTVEGVEVLPSTHYSLVFRSISPLPSEKCWAGASVVQEKDLLIPQSFSSPSKSNRPRSLSRQEPAKGRGSKQRRVGVESHGGRALTPNE